MRKKRLLTIVALLLTCIMLLTACGKNSGNSSDATDKMGQNTQETSSAPKTLEVRKLKLLGFVNDTALWDTRNDQPMWKAYEEMLKEANLELEYEAISQEQYQTVLQTRLATATDLPDLVTVSTLDDPTIINLGKTGILLDIIPLVEQYSNGNIKAMSEKYFKNFWGPVITEDGKAYCLPGWNVMTHSGNQPFYSLMTPLIRLDWLEKLDIPIPQTMDELTAALKAFREKDANSNGKADEVMLFEPSFEFIAPYFGLPKGHVSVDISDNKAKSPWLMKDKLIPYIEWLQDMVKSGVLDVDSLGKPYEYKLQKIKANQVSCQTGFLLTGQYDADVAEYNGAYLGVITPKDPDDFYIYVAPPDSVVSKTAITKNCKDIQAAIDYFDLVYTEKYATLYRFGVEGISHTVQDGIIIPKKGLGERDFDMSGKAPGATLAPGLLPCLRIEQWEAQTETLGNYINLRKPLGDKYACGGAKYYVWGNYQQAMATDADAQRLAEISTDLNTYMNETLTKLALGQYKVEDLDIYINKMKELGLEEMVAIVQRNHDRYIGKSK